MKEWEELTSITHEEYVGQVNDKIIAFMERIH